MTYDLRRQRITVLLGCLVVAGGWIGYLALVWGDGSVVRGESRTNAIFGIGSVLGYAVLALASWSWFTWMESSPLHLAGIARVPRLFALGNLLLAAGLAAVGYFWANQVVTQHYDGQSAAAATTYGLESLGFLLAAVAFWDASREVRTARPDLPATEVELVTA